MNNERIDSTLAKIRTLKALQAHLDAMEKIMNEIEILQSAADKPENLKAGEDFHMSKFSSFDED